MAPFKIALVGERKESAIAHQAIPVALEMASEANSVPIDVRWVPTDGIRTSDDVAEFDALWCVPASPYRSMEGALIAIRYARQHGIRFLGTCGGFQHAVVEYARNVLGWADADQAETAPDAERQVIAPLTCSLLEVSGPIRFYPGTKIAEAYGVSEAVEGYHCRYGINPAFRAELTKGPLRSTAEDENGDPRAIELDGHPFFVATLFQPERAALRGELPPLVNAFVKALAPATVAK